MSALLSPTLGSRAGFLAAAQRRQAQLRVVPRIAAQVSQRSFWTFLLALVVVGTTLLLMLNVTLQNQAFRLRTLAAQAQVLKNEQADLQQQLSRRSSSGQLAQRALDMGMVPDTTPGFVMVPDGTVVGDAKPATAGGPYAGLRNSATAAQPQPSTQPPADATQAQSAPQAQTTSQPQASPSSGSPSPASSPGTNQPTLTPSQGR
ncbi:hypothetical protein [Raineyella fluvialis]|uniref:Cell division protein FtsL n=1 Tax=Raineyella fluvialis TaxID=2662261 RepID=A0A5Q2FB31_9ACTN|nr:hypothetical protein [Raineyella fluvialis]QGF24230.1 hypothetical protein Rai3103_11740 [Raineyella fluvialis]